MKLNGREFEALFLIWKTSNSLEPFLYDKVQKSMYDSLPL